MGCTKHSLYRHGGKRSGMVCVQRRRSRTRASGQIRTVRRAHLRVRVLTARQTNSVRALQTAGRDAAEGPGDSVAARLRQPSGTPQPTGGPETPNRTPKAPDSPRLDVSCRARARGTDGFAGETALFKLPTRNFLRGTNAPVVLGEFNFRDRKFWISPGISPGHARPRSSRPLPPLPLLPSSPLLFFSPPLPFRSLRAWAGLEKCMKHDGSAMRDRDVNMDVQ